MSDVPIVENKTSEPKSKSTLGAISESTVFSLPKRRSGNIVNLVLKILDEDGPRPMKNMRPVQKTRNGADQFDMDHHGEYEARGQPSRDQIGRVDTHNSAFPKMYDELNRRRSTAQPAAYSAAYDTANQNPAPNTYFDPNCRKCVKLKRQAELDSQSQRLDKRSKQYRNSRTKSNLRPIKTKIAKPKRSQRSCPYQCRCNSRKFKLSKIMTNKGCQCTSYYVPAETKSGTFNEKFFMPLAQEMKQVAAGAGPGNLCSNENYDSKNIASQKQSTRKASCKKSKSKSDIDSGNPETNTAPSLSSYNSFMSMEHEPMIE